MVKRSSDKIKYGGYPQDSIFDDLPIEYKQSLFTKRPIDNLTDNSVERLKVSSVEWSLGNKIYKSNHQNADLDDLPWNGDERLIAIWPIDSINGDVVFISYNGWRFYVEDILI